MVSSTISAASLQSSALLYRDRSLNEGGSTNIRNVWVENFEIELPIISELLDKYPYVAMVRSDSFKLYKFSYNLCWLFYNFYI